MKYLESIPSYFFAVIILMALAVPQRADSQNLEITDHQMNWQLYKLYSPRLSFDDSIFLDEGSRIVLGPSYLKGYMDGVNNDFNSHSIFVDSVKYDQWYSKGYTDGSLDRNRYFTYREASLENVDAKFFGFNSYLMPYRSVLSWLQTVANSSSFTPFDLRINYEDYLAFLSTPSEADEKDYRVVADNTSGDRNQKGVKGQSEKRLLISNLEDYIDDKGLGDRLIIIDSNNDRRINGLINRRLSPNDNSIYIGRSIDRNAFFNNHRNNGTSNNGVRGVIINNTSANDRSVNNENTDQVHKKAHITNEVSNN